MLRGVLSVVLATCVGAGAAFAQEAPKKKAPRPRPTAEQRFQRLDTDSDGKLTLAELTARLTNEDSKAKAEKLFKEADKGSKGHLTLDEFKTIYDKLNPPPKKTPADKPVDKAPVDKKTPVEKKDK
jgi:hypothetical protein